MRRLSLFYSWQSDRDSKLCRKFIQQGLERAAEIVADRDIELVIDSDTKGVPGTPPISDTILQKIEACDIFLGDMTFVAKTEGGKFVPNPNVMGEYGYALRAKGSERILLSMNKAFGNAEELPFDLRHMRHPLAYDAPEDISDGERRRRREQFARLLAGAIVPIARYGQTTVREEAKQVASDLLVQHLNEYAAGGRPIIVSGPRLVLRVVPFTTGDTKLQAARVSVAVSGFKPRTGDVGFTLTSERMWAVHAPLVQYADKPNKEASWSLALFRPGILEFAVTLGRRVDDDPTILLSGHQIEAWVVRMSERIVALAVELSLPGPFLIHAAFERMEDVDVHAVRMHIMRNRRPDIALQPHVVALGLASVGQQLRPLLDDFWNALGRSEGSPSFANEEWAGDQPARGDYSLE